MRDFEVCVIGGGPGGYSAAIRAWDFGKRVCLIEPSKIGGAGIHNGALSSKTLWELSRDYRRVGLTNRGYLASNVELSFERLKHCVREAVAEKQKQLEYQLEALSTPDKESGGSIKLIRGRAKFLDPHLIQISDLDGNDTRSISADNFILATGSTPRILDSVHVDGEVIMTSDHVMDIKNFPDSIVILGAGVIGCEFATIFSNFGRTRVYMIDRADRILPFEDEDIAQLCSTNLEAQGTRIHSKAKMVSMEEKNGRVVYTIAYPSGGKETLEVEKALVSVGRVPNTKGLGLENAGIKLTDRGHIESEDTRTSRPHIFAVGDVTFDVALVSVAEIEGRHAAELICEANPKPISYDNLSTIMFLDPEVAAIGINEQTAQEKKIPYRVAVYGHSLINRAIAMRATDGFMKLLVTDDDRMEILGMRSLGAHASTTIEAASLMIKHGRSIQDLAELFHPHPAITEGLQECVRMLFDSSVMKPHVFKQDLRLSRVTY